MTIINSTSVSTGEDVKHVNLKCLGEYTHAGNKTITYCPNVLFLIYYTSLLKIPRKKSAGVSQDTNNEDIPPVHQFQHGPLDLIQADSFMSVIHVFNLKFSIENALLGCNYVDQGNNKWLSPNSTSGSAGASVIQSTNNPWRLMYTHHASDVELYGAMHDAFDLGAMLFHKSKKEFTEEQSKVLMAIDPDTGNALDITVDEYNKQQYRKIQNLPAIAQKKFNPIKTISGAELENKDLPPISFVIAGLLPAGRTLLVANPKQGKSWFVLYLVILVSAGQPIFGRHVKPQKSVYFALEDNEARINSRSSNIYSQFNISKEDKNNWSSSFELDSIGNGFEEAILDYLSKEPDTSFMAIDVLGKIRPKKEVQSVYKADYAIGNALKVITDQYPQLAILVVHHTNKGDKLDVVSMVSGSNGLPGSFDNIFGIVGDKLLVTGRDLESEEEIELVKNNQGQYTMTTPDITNSMSGTRKAVYDFIENNSDDNKYVTPKEIEVSTGLSINDINQQLKRLLTTGLITKPQRGQYTV